MKNLRITIFALAMCAVFLSGANLFSLRQAKAWKAKYEARAATDNPKSTLPNLETLMPKFEVRSNAPNDYRVAFMAHGSTNWEVVAAILPTREDAEAVIAKSKALLEIKYEAGKHLINALEFDRR